MAFIVASAGEVAPSAVVGALVAPPGPPDRVHAARAATVASKTTWRMAFDIESSLDPCGSPAAAQGGTSSTVNPSTSTIAPQPIGRARSGGRGAASLMLRRPPPAGV